MRVERRVEVAASPTFVLEQLAQFQQFLLLLICIR